MASYFMHKEDQDINTKSSVLSQLLEIFDSALDVSLIERVAESCNYKIQDCIDTLIIYSQTDEPLTACSSNNRSAAKNSLLSNNAVLQSNKAQTSKVLEPFPYGDVQMNAADSSKDNVTEHVNFCNSEVDKASKNCTNNINSYKNAYSLNESTSHFNSIQKKVQSNTNDCVDSDSSQDSVKREPLKPTSPILVNDNQKIEYNIRQGYKVMLIMRGLPGSGKSYLAKRIVERTIGQDYNPSACIFSTDDFFVNHQGIYSFNILMLNENHLKNQDRVLRAAERGVSPLIVDNTNTQLWEMIPYINIAINYGYYFYFVESNTPWAWKINELFKRNIHSIPKLSIQRTADQYEHNLTPDICLRRLNIKYDLNKQPPKMRSYPPLNATHKEQRPQRLLQKSKSQKIKEVFSNLQTEDSDTNLIRFFPFSINPTKLKIKDNKNEVKDTIDNFESNIDNETTHVECGNTCNDFNFMLDGKQIHNVDMNLFSSSKEKSDVTGNPIGNLSTSSQYDKDIFDMMCKMESCMKQTDNTSLNINKNDDNEEDPKELVNIINVTDDKTELNCKNDSISNDISQFSITDNINLITWKVSPFPVHDIFHTEKNNQICENVSVSDKSTNTCAEDFNVLLTKLPLSEEYKIIIARNRDVKDCYVPILTEQLTQSKLMLHKSCMTDNIEESYEFVPVKMENDEYKENENFKQCMKILIEMFPDVPDDYIYDVFVNACNCDLNWTTEVLLHGSSQDLMKYKNEDPSKFSFINSNNASKPKIDIKRNQPLSSSKIMSRKKEKDEETIALQKYLEEKIQHKATSYHPHILRVKRWKQREPDIKIDEIDLSAYNENAIEFEDNKYEVSNTENNYNNVQVENEEYDLTSSPSSSSSSSLFEDMIEIKVGKEFIEDLERQFGDSEFQFPGGIFPVIQMKKSKAQELYALWLESMQQQQKAHKALTDELIEHDERYARLVQEQEDDEKEEESNEKKRLVEEVNRDLNLDIFKHLSNEEQKTYADKVREEGWKEYNLSQQCLSEAQEAYKNSDENAIQLQLEANRHEKKSSYLFMLASGMYVKLSNNNETLDLHYLLVREAVEAVELFLSHHIEKLKNRSEHYVTLFIITGRGLNSNGKSKIKPAVCKLLCAKKIKYTEANAGCLKVRLWKKTLHFRDL